MGGGADPGYDFTSLIQAPGLKEGIARKQESTRGYFFAIVHFPPYLTGFWQLKVCACAFVHLSLNEIMVKNVSERNTERLTLMAAEWADG